MVTHSVIPPFRGISAALQIPFQSGEDSEGFFVRFGGYDSGQWHTCRTIREAIESLSSRAANSLSQREDADRIHAIFFPPSKLTGINTLIEKGGLDCRKIHPTD